eukprot:TRINITY_DN2152_c1_g1_i1.p1 TRINITY_DN2152_c1_g1~~TRINITY_DN2152_c1_g1_i1.p1  ORF type:complete len:241 (-),score=-20.19 TRINITY_DN2152_c1_g1_i1:708-1430(-)
MFYTQNKRSIQRTIQYFNLPISVHKRSMVNYDINIIYSPTYLIVVVPKQEGGKGRYSLRANYLSKFIPIVYLSHSQRKKYDEFQGLNDVIIHSKNYGLDIYRMQSLQIFGYQIQKIIFSSCLYFVVKIFCTITWKSSFQFSDYIYLNIYVYFSRLFLIKYIFLNQINLNLICNQQLIILQRTLISQITIIIIIITINIKYNNIIIIQSQFLQGSQQYTSNFIYWEQSRNIYLCLLCINKI